MYSIFTQRDVSCFSMTKNKEKHRERIKNKEKTNEKQGKTMKNNEKQQKICFFFPRKHDIFGDWWINYLSSFLNHVPQIRGCWGTL